MKEEDERKQNNLKIENLISEKKEKEEEIVPLETILSNIDRDVELIIDSAPNNTLFIVCGGEGFNGEFFRISKEKKNNPNWNFTNQVNLESLVTNLRTTFVNFLIKN